MPTKKAVDRAPNKRVVKVESVSDNTPSITTASPMANNYSLSAMLSFINNNFLLLVLGGGLFLFGFVFGSMWKENQTLRAGGGSGSVAQQPAAQQQQAPPEAAPLSDADWKEIQKDPVMVIGNKNAKITMVEFTDYQCPFCGRYYTDTHKQLVEDYVKSGKMKIVLRDQPLSFHPNANSAAQLVRCTAEQGKAEQMHDQLFTNQAIWTPLSGDALFAKYAELANAAGANGDKAVSCVKSDKYKKATEADSTLAQRVGAGGTPTFFIEKEPLVGAQPLASFKAKIDQKLGGGIGLPNAGKGGN